MALFSLFPIRAFFCHHITFSVFEFSWEVRESFNFSCLISRQRSGISLGAGARTLYSSILNRNCEWCIENTYISIVSQYFNGTLKTHHFYYRVILSKITFLVSCSTENVKSSKGLTPGSSRFTDGLGPAFPSSLGLANS